ncbi:MAG: hypothetical protein RID09_12145 [Coleofasciculus sp. G1-WW12-02]|uniref:hypothetical protein n=1 Tax=Coleofasciculus sp. G1-WW12-02 TaxID=3068483 RepID=UPI0032FB4DF3
MSDYSGTLLTGVELSQAEKAAMVSAIAHLETFSPTPYVPWLPFGVMPRARSQERWMV